jgi:hypothetical protein
MNLQERITKDMQAALKNKNKAELDTLRTVVSELKDERIKKMKDLTEDDVLNVLNRAVKKRREAIQLYKQGNRPDLVENEQNQVQIIQKYLPEQLSEEEMISVLERILNQVGADSERDIGKVMGPAMQELKGKADGKVVKELVRKMLISKA